MAVGGSQLPRDFLRNVPKTTEQPWKMREFMDMQIHNIMFHMSVKTKINLEYVAECGNNTTMLSLEKLQLKLQDPYTIVHLTKRGTVLGMAGCVTEVAAALAATRVVMFLKKVGYHIRVHTFRIVNVKATGQVPFRIDIKSLQQHNHKHLNYFFYKEDDHLPRLRTFIPSISTTIIIIDNGQLIFFAPNVEKLLQGCKFIYPHLRPWAILPKVSQQTAVETKDVKE